MSSPRTHEVSNDSQHVVGPLLPAHTPPFRLLAWPRWENPWELIALLRQFGTPLSARDDAVLILRVDETTDGPIGLARYRLQQALAALDHNRPIQIHLLADVPTEWHWKCLGQEVTLTAVLPSLSTTERAQFAAAVNAPLMHTQANLETTLEHWDHMKRGNANRALPVPQVLSPIQHTVRLPPAGHPPTDWLARCLPRRRPANDPRLAVIVPYRDRADHLAQLIPYLTEYLSHLPFDIFVVEQADDKPFNRAKLFNIGFDQVGSQYDYFAFHDVDLFPIQADYSYVDHPTHLAARVAPGFELFYEECMGGVCLLNREHMLRINGFCNEYWGWGAEDDDLYARLVQSRLTVHRRDGLYDTLPHESNAVRHALYEDNLNRAKDIREGRTTSHTDGLNTLSYTLVGLAFRTDFIHIRVHV